MDTLKDIEHKGKLLAVTNQPQKNTKHPRLKLIGILLAGLLVFYPLSCSTLRHKTGVHHATHDQKTVHIADVCPQVDPLSPSSDRNRKLAEELGASFADSAFEAVAAEYLGAAVRIPLVLVASEPYAYNKHTLIAQSLMMTWARLGKTLAGRSSTSSQNIY